MQRVDSLEKTPMLGGIRRRRRRGRQRMRWLDGITDSMVEGAINFTAKFSIWVRLHVSFEQRHIIPEGPAHAGFPDVVHFAALQIEWLCPCFQRKKPHFGSKMSNHKGIRASLWQSSKFSGFLLFCSYCQSCSLSKLITQLRNQTKII